MNKIDKQVEKIKKSGKIGLMTHVVVGYPSIEKTVELVLALAEGGSDFIELQIPFSDPIADGPTIMQASDIALKNGVTVETGMNVMKEMSTKVEVPLLFMCYFNSVFSYGVERFCKDASAAGASGLIIPDVPPEEEKHEHISSEAEKNGLYLIRVISPASSNERLAKNAELAKGFVYCVSRFGVTGAKNTLAPELSEYLAKVSHSFSLPRAVGFGISSPGHIQSLKGNAEIAVVGSAIIEKIKKEIEKSTDFKYISQYITELKN